MTFFLDLRPSSAKTIRSDFVELTEYIIGTYENFPIFFVERPAGTGFSGESRNSTGNILENCRSWTTWCP